MYDHVEAYATTIASGVEGKAKGEGRGDVASVVETSGLSASLRPQQTANGRRHAGFR
jgi:hypothetical protein